MNVRARNIIVTLAIEFVVIVAAAAIAWHIALKDYFADWPSGDRWVVPSEHTAHIDEPGGYKIFWEHTSVLDSVDYSRDDIPHGFKIVVVDESNGDSLNVAVLPPESSSYTGRDRAAQSLFAVRLPHPGDYRITARYVDGSVEPPVVISLVSDNTFWTFFFGLALVLVLTPILCAVPLLYFALKKYPPAGPPFAA